MNWLYLIVGIITLAILVYLVAALLNPLRPLDDPEHSSGRLNPVEPTRE